MKAYIIDASTTLKWLFIDDPNSENAKHILQDYLTGKIILLAPNLWVYEVVNGIRSAVLGGRITHKKGSAFVKLILKAKPELTSIEGLEEICFETANKYKISVYDASYIALAVENKTPLITSDSKLAYKANSLGKLMLYINNYR